ncbi:MAG: DUF1311 domain-containing protein [Spirochaetia bacterium]|nr:DUF1311 domain-containing protein [Spirochaetia bacterium]
MLIVISFNFAYSQALKKSDVDRNSENCDEKMSQTSMNLCAKNKYLKAEKYLEKMFQEIIKKEENFFDDKKLDKESIKQLKLSEKNWNQYRKNYCEFVGSRFKGGSIRPFAYWTCMNDFTRNRTEELKIYPGDFL